MNYQEILRHITSWEKTTFLIRNNACSLVICVATAYDFTRAVGGHERGRQPLQLKLPSYQSAYLKTVESEVKGLSGAEPEIEIKACPWLREIDFCSCSFC